MPQELIDFLPERLERALAQVTTSDEAVHIKLKGAFKEALVCTSRKVIILKAGFMTGNSFGANTFQMPYGRIGGAEVKFHLLSGYFELSSSGVENTEKSYWSTQGESSNPSKAPNCVAINDRAQVPRFRAACDFILTFQPNQAAATIPSAVVEEDVVSVLERLGGLKERGILTDEEFQTKKAEVMASWMPASRSPINMSTPADPALPVSGPDPDPDPDAIPAREADAMIARYMASKRVTAPGGATKQEPPVFGRRR